MTKLVIKLIVFIILARLYKVKGCLCDIPGAGERAPARVCLKCSVYALRSVSQ